MQVTKSDSRPYGYTLRRCSKTVPITEGLYLKQLAVIAKLGIVVSENVFETTAGLHCHGVMTIAKNFNFKRLRVRGWNIKLVEIFDALGWQMYTMKAPDKVLPEDAQQVPPDEDVNPP